MGHTTVSKKEQSVEGCIEGKYRAHLIKEHA